MLVLIKCCLIVLLVRFTGAQCPVSRAGIHSYGDICQFRCRCKDGTRCVQSTGQCLGGCAQGFMGPACQYANLAFGRSTSQSSTYPADQGLDQFNSHVAVDGDSATCTQTYSQQEPWWSVDLGEVRQIVALEIITTQEGLNSFTIAVSNSTIDQTSPRSVCYQQSGGDTVESTTVRDVTCWSPVTGRYLFMHRPVEETEMKLCEVKIYGGRELAYKKPASQSSTLRNTTGASAANDGTPSNGISQYCSTTQITDEPSWTVDLLKPYRIQRVVIHSRGSLDLLRGFWLWVRQQSGVYGDGAYLYIQQDPITSATTEVVFGHLPVGRYIEILLPGKGQQLSLCEVEVYGDCADDTCGADCSQPCWCNTTVTGNTLHDGVCPYGCSDRAMVDTPGCEIGCDSEHWGVQCSKSCGHCANETACNVRTGQCEQGCTEGFISPPMCNDGCVTGLYGEGCDLPCGMCAGSGSCDPVTGVCDSGCQAGYEGLMCTEECNNNTWGLDCGKTCGRCANGLACNTKTGHCLGHCETGFREPPLCDAGCKVGHYGADCKQCGMCHEGRQCDMVTGHCDNCSLGYQPPYCNKVCDGGTFGFACRQRCGNCLDWRQCDVITGACPSGCQAGWSGSNCTIVGSGEVLSASTDEETNAQRKLMGIVLGTVGGVLLICLVGFAYLNWVKRRKRSENIAHEKTKMKEFYPDQNKNHHGYDEAATKC